MLLISFILFLYNNLFHFIRYVKFLQYLDVLTSDDFEYLNPKGIIPAKAILKVGEQVRTHVSKKDNNQMEKNGEDAGESDDDEDLAQANQAELEG